MKRSATSPFPYGILALFLCISTTGCGVSGEESDGLQTSSHRLAGADPHHFELAFHWAPVHFQRVNTAKFDGAPDFITNFDYDGNFAGGDNWDNLSQHLPNSRHPIRSYVYYAVSESTTHYFLYYTFYHPRDWVFSTCGDGEHENDGESILVFVRKNGTIFGTLEGAITAGHVEFRDSGLIAYRAPGVALETGRGAPVFYRYPYPYSTRRGVRDMVLSFGLVPNERHGRPWTYQEPGGHGVYACGETEFARLRDCDSLSDVVRYIPGRYIPEKGAAPPRGGQITKRYFLLEMTAPRGLFERRHNPETFGDYKVAYNYAKNGQRTYYGNESGSCGDGCPTCSGSALAAWGMNDQKDALQPLVFGKDPARFLRAYFDFSTLGDPSSDYIKNDFGAGGNVCLASQHPLDANPSYSPQCVQKICRYDSYCCRNHWNKRCVDRVTTICGASCDTCTHAVSDRGVALRRGCNPCVSEVCNMDPWCCNYSWDGVCVNEAASCSTGVPNLKYRVHQQDKGWIGTCADGQSCGYVHELKRLEAIRIYNPASGGKVCYTVYVKDLGWLWSPKDPTSWPCNGQMAGTTGQKRRIEAVRIRLVGAPPGHRICYRVHKENLGWSAVEKCDGEMAGTTGQRRRIESIEVKIDTGS